MFRSHKERTSLYIWKYNIFKCRTKTEKQRLYLLQKQMEINQSFVSSLFHLHLYFSSW